jgi:glycine dehydrogenase subunit 2
MIEPTETESKETLDAFIADFRAIVATAKVDPAAILAAPVQTVVGRIDETRAARYPDLRWHPPAASGVTAR